MTLKEITKNMHAMLEELSKNLMKAERGVKAAAQRVRTGSIQFSKLSKQYRRESMIAETGGGKKKALLKKGKTTRRKKKSGSVYSRSRTKRL